jgi:hypothetical protein
MKHDSAVFSDTIIDAAHKLARTSTDQRTRETREALARGETPALMGALTANDLLRWIQNAERK